MNTLIVLLLSAIVVFAIKVASDKYNKIKTDIIIKTFAVMLCLLGIVRYFLSDSFVETVTNFGDPLQSFLRWGYHIGYSVIPMSVFFNNRLFRNIASYFSLPVSLACAICYENTFAYFVASGAGGYYIDVHVRHLLYSLELILAISTPILMQLHHKHLINLKTPKELLMMLGIIPLIMIQMVPSYIFKSLMPDPGLDVGMFGTLHIIWLVSLVAEIVVLYYVFRKRSPEQKYQFMVFLVISQVMHTMSPFLRGFTYSRLPLQLCNIAAFFYLYMIITKDRRMYNFGYLANLVGALIAMVLTDFSSDTLNFWNMHYVYEHSFVVMVPILCSLLGIFPRLDKSAIKHMLTIFAVYFGFIFIFGTLINGIDDTPGSYAVNHFYMFNPAVAVDYLPFAGFTSLIHWQFGDYEIYPILVVTIFILFSCLNLAFFGLTQLGYKIIDKVKGKKVAEREKVTV